MQMKDKVMAGLKHKPPPRPVAVSYARNIFLYFSILHAYLRNRVIKCFDMKARMVLVVKSFVQNMEGPGFSLGSHLPSCIDLE